MPRCKIANWTPIQEMCRNRFTGKTAEKVEVRATTLAQLHAEEEVAAFEREGTVAEEAMESMVEEAMEVVAKEAAMAALCEIRDEAAMASLEAVAKESTKVAVRELRQDVVAREASAKMYMDDAAAEEDRVADAAEVASTWELVNGDETEVEDGEDEEEEHDAELYATEAAIHAASAHREAEMAARAMAELRATKAAIHAASIWKNPSSSNFSNLPLYLLGMV
jgi:hypothetical protein